VLIGGSFRQRRGGKNGLKIVVKFRVDDDYLDWAHKFLEWVKSDMCGLDKETKRKMISNAMIRNFKLKTELKMEDDDTDEI
jgi:hypothetical protein